MQRAIASSISGWGRIGFPDEPTLEYNPPGSRARIDLYSPGMVAECKRFADTRALTQVDHYVELLGAAGVTSPTGRWVRQIISGEGHSRELARQIAARDDVQLLLCLRTEDGLAFVDIPDEHWTVDELIEQPPQLLRRIGDEIAEFEVISAELAELTGAKTDAAVPEPPEEDDPDRLQTWYEELEPVGRLAVEREEVEDAADELRALLLAAADRLTVDRAALLTDLSQPADEDWAVDDNDPVAIIAAATDAQGQLLGAAIRIARLAGLDDDELDALLADPVAHDDSDVPRTLAAQALHSAEVVADALYDLGLTLAVPEVELDELFAAEEE